MKAEELLKGVNVKKIHGKLPSEITFVTDDSLKATAGCLFIARKGNNHDGKDYIKAATDCGAAAVLGEEFVAGAPCFIEVESVAAAIPIVLGNFYFPIEKPPRLIGVVGTNGKTSVCHILSRVLEKCGCKTGVIGTIGVYCSDKKQDLGLTTPGTFELYKILAEMKSDGVEIVIMEVSAHAIAQNRTGNLFFEALIFTNCTEDHLDYFGDFDSYAKVKRSIFKPERTEKMIVNADDELGREIIAQEGLNAVSYGIYNPSDVFAIITSEREDGTEFILNLMDYVKTIKIKLIGEHNVYNVLAALTCAAAIGVNPLVAACAVEETEQISGRCELIGEFNGGNVFLDYAHTPDGLLKTLTALKRVCSNKLYCVFGCGGNREKEKREKMGEISAYNADFTVITDDNPRFENPEEIRLAIERGVKNAGGGYKNIADRKTAIEYAVSLLKSGDILLVAGKGAEEYQEVQGVKYPFSDKAVIKEIIFRNRGER